MSEETHRILTSSVEPNWRTSGWLKQALNREFKLGLDIAADSDTSTIVPDRWLGPNSPYGVEDALVFNSWEEFLQDDEAGVGNPPYRRGNQKKGITAIPIEPWIATMARTGQHRTMIGILPYAPQTKHWRQYIVGHEFRATEIRKFPFRVRFDPPPDYVSKAEDGKTHGANVNTVVVIWRPTNEYPKALPWAPFERYWVPVEHPQASRYHGVTPFEEPEDGE